MFRRLIVVVALVLPFLANAASVAVPVPPKPRLFSEAIETYAPYHPQVWCLPYTRPGTKALGELLVHTYPGTSYGTVRSCGKIGAKTSSTSEHYDGRALDWMVSVRNATQKAYGDALVGWLLAKDRFGHPAAMLRRLGIMYVIWNNRMWGSWDQSWHPYLDCAKHPEPAYDNTCHRTHVHISLSWLGAWKLTSFWGHKVAVYP
jgi:hypothetical protein